MRASCSEDEWEVLIAVKVSRKIETSCVVQPGWGADLAPVGDELVPSKKASDCCSVSDSQQLVLASSDAWVMPGALQSSHNDPVLVVLVRLTSEEVRAEHVS